MPLALLTSNIRAAVSEQRVYDYSVREYDASAVSGIPEAELIRANGEIHRYLTAQDGGPLMADVPGARGESVPLFSDRETQHMADVRDLVRTLLTVQALSVAGMLTLAVLVLAVSTPRTLAAAAVAGAALTIGVLAAAGMVVASGFDSAWSQFHVFAFNNELWELDPERDHLIQMFPEAFWLRITVAIGVLTLLEAVVIASAGLVYLSLRRRLGVEAGTARPRAPQAASRPVPQVPSTEHGC